MFKTLIKSVREYKVPSILAPLFVMLEVILDVIIPLLMARLIDNMKTSDVKMMIILIVLLLAGASLALLFGFLSGKFAAQAASGFAKNLRKDMFYKIQEYSFENIDRFSASSLVTRMTTDVSNMQMSYGLIIRVAVRAPFMLISSIIMAFTVNKTLALVFCCVVPVMLITFGFIIKFAMKLFKSVFKKYDKFNESIQENINGIRVVKTYVRESYEQEKFNRASDSLRKDFTKAERIVAINNPVMQGAMYIVFMAITIIGAHICINTANQVTPDLTTGQLQSLLTYGIQILFSVMILSQIVVMLTISFEGGRRISEVINEKSTLANCDNPIYEVKSGSIEIKNVSFKYSKTAEKNALENVNLTIPTGSTVGIIGGTGSSKTTLVNLISRLYDVTEGELLVDGINVKDYDLKTLRDNVAVVLQKNVLFSGTIAENLRWGKENATLEELEEACKLSCADEFINRFPDKYETYIEQGGTNVSGGQKQRLCIARALLKAPKILILDDSTSAVDTKTDAVIRDGFKKFIPETTKIIIAQRIASVEDADMIIVLDGGKINGIGTHKELLKSNDIYKEVYDVQVQNKGGNE